MSYCSCQCLVEQLFFWISSNPSLIEYSFFNGTVVAIKETFVAVVSHSEHFQGAVAPDVSSQYLVEQLYRLISSNPSLIEHSFFNGNVVSIKETIFAIVSRSGNSQGVVAHDVSSQFLVKQLYRSISSNPSLIEHIFLMAMLFSPKILLLL